MKTMRFYQVLFFLLILSLMSMKCNPDPVEVEGDTDGPELSIINPDNNDIFYVEGGSQTPNYLILEADASDTSTITIGSVTVYNSSEEEVFYYEETSSTQNGASISTIYTSFTTEDIGENSIVFEFEDAAGNSSSITRIATCLASESNLPS